MSVFEPFLDTEDLTACVDAGETPAGLNARCAPAHCAFPLWLDPQQSFGDLFLGARAAPRSFRYGFLGDNVLGLRWRLPGGAELGLGGRVMKNVTGFDLIRFLSASQGRFGEPLNLVLRLRPLAESRLDLRLEGPWPALKSLARTLRSSSWAHVLDICDLHARPQAAAIHVSFSAKAALLPLFEAQARAWAKGLGLNVSTLDQAPPVQARPWARAQAGLDDCVDLAQEWLGRYGGSVHAMLGQGVVHLQDPSSTQGAEQGLSDLHRRLAEQGGSCEGPALAPDPEAPQARWEAELLRRLKEIA
ncbi:MAG TPA: hypothetical protein VK914_13300 [bacterium]|jgi:hypothetical protein|nr:hypothetical protein [bacterium]